MRGGKILAASASIDASAGSTPDGEDLITGQFGEDTKGWLGQPYRLGSLEGIWEGVFSVSLSHRFDS